MILQEKRFCSEQNLEVEAVLEVIKTKTGEETVPVACANMAACDAKVFCRFVNPLTQRNPLVDVSVAGRSVEAG